VIQIEPLGDGTDRAWVAERIRVAWGGEPIVSRGRRYRLVELAGFIAWDGPNRVGSATYRIEAGECGLLTIEAVDRQRGIGTALISAVENAAREAGCAKVWLTTTNDNLDALRFYQRRGYRLVAIFPNEMDEIRMLKDVSHVGSYGIPLLDGLELEKGLDTRDRLTAETQRAERD
jgi:ribosomal protein S18 acetylase RimI-like enzyme